jgi:amino acid transporter
MTTRTETGRPPRTPTLRRELGFLETTAMSVGVMAPTLAMSVTGIAAAQQLGRAAPLAFVVAGLGVGLVAYGFIRLAAEYSSAGSVYAFVGHALSARMGLIAGWALLGTYLVFPPVSIMGVAVFGQAFLRSAGLADHADWYPLALGAWAVIWLLAARGIRPTTRSLLLVEVVSVVLITVLMAVIVVRLAAGVRTSTGGGGFTASVLSLPPGIGVDVLAVAATSGFLAFAGFESAGSLGEESVRPRRSIPRAIVTAVVFGAVFYVACMITQSLGFGADQAGVAAFRQSDAPLGDLARHFVGTPFATTLDAAAVLSAIGAGLGGVTVGARMMFAFARDGLGVRRLSEVAPRTSGPAQALCVEMLFGLVVLTTFRLIVTAPLDVFFYLATIGVLNLLVMYIITNVAAVRHLARRSLGECVLPVAGTAVAAFVLYHNVWPVPDPPYRYLPYIALSWLVIGVILSAVPRIRAGIERGLARRTE